MAPGLVPDGFVGVDEWIDRLEALKVRGLSLHAIRDLRDANDVPMLARVEALTPEQIADLNEAAL